MKRNIGIACAVGYVSTVVLANWLTTRYGFVPVGLGFAATAGTFAAGAALAMRDAAQDTLGRVGVLALIVVASALSFVVAAPQIATASAAAFLIGEALDMAVYTPLRARGGFGSNWWTTAVIVSGLVGAVADTVAFLWIAFGREALTDTALAGQLVGKAWPTLAFVTVGVVGRALLREPVHAAGA